MWWTYIHTCCPCCHFTLYLCPTTPQGTKFQKTLKYPPKKISYADDGVFVIKKKKIFDFFWNLKVFEDAHWSGRGSWSVHRIQVGDQGREQGGGNGWVGCKSKLKGMGHTDSIPKFLKTEARGTIFDIFQNLKKTQTNRP